MGYLRLCHLVVEKARIARPSSSSHFGHVQQGVMKGTSHGSLPASLHESIDRAREGCSESPGVRWRTGESPKTWCVCLSNMAHFSTIASRSHVLTEDLSLPSNLSARLQDPAMMIRTPVFGCPWHIALRNVAATGAYLA